GGGVGGVAACGGRPLPGDCIRARHNPPIDRSLAAVHDLVGRAAVPATRHILEHRRLLIRLRTQVHKWIRATESLHSKLQNVPPGSVTHVTTDLTGKPSQPEARVSAKGASRYSDIRHAIHDKSP